MDATSTAFFNTVASSTLSFTYEAGTFIVLGLGLALGAVVLLMIISYFADAAKAIAGIRR